MDRSLPSNQSIPSNVKELSNATPISSPRHFLDADTPDAEVSPSSEDFRNYSKMIHKIARIMDLQVQQSATSESCNFFGHLDKAQTPPLQFGFIPSLQDRIKSAWTKPSSVPLMTHRINNMYLDAIQNRAKSSSNTMHSNEEGRKVHLIGRCHYSLASFFLRTSNFLCAMEAYNCYLMQKFFPILCFVPQDQQEKALYYHKEVMSLINYEMISS
ncbi:hypothetical protein JRQ81_004612 [Phrynocephalus forsythii]|uniref:Uncharacterized protein n=1 Tax=Phrynocephalus forsythii TaxID=171643 RepID=A0A9Q0XFK0_9SAUR|nr:hypothetical protein JRQ81_004612 [Phrynocephalus forsythii]